MKRIFVFEYLTAGGPVDGDESVVRALLPLGLAMRDAMVGDLLRDRGFGVTAATSERAPAAAAGARPGRAEAGESMLQWVTREAERHDAVWLVAPETGGLLAQFQQNVPAGRWLGCEAAAIRLASSKDATLAHLAGHGMLTPLAFADTATRWVVKPDDGAGAVATSVHRHLRAAQEAKRAGSAGGAMTLEPWVDGDPMSMSLLCCRGGTELLSINRQHIDIAPDGQLTYRGVSVDRRRNDGAKGEALAALACQVGRAIPGLQGFVGVDLVWHATQGPVVIEVNPRITCAYVGLSAHLGRNLASEMMTDLMREANAETALEPRHAGA
ncbi:MAG TPA: ATP-grasp domain-containing protein [Rubrivivax sp.]